MNKKNKNYNEAVPVELEDGIHYYEPGTDVEIPELFEPYDEANLDNNYDMHEDLGDESNLDDYSEEGDNLNPESEDRESDSPSTNSERKEKDDNKGTPSDDSEETDTDSKQRSGNNLNSMATDHMGKAGETYNKVKELTKDAEDITKIVETEGADLAADYRIAKKYGKEAVKQSFKIQLTLAAVAIGIISLLLGLFSMALLGYGEESGNISYSSVNLCGALVSSDSSSAAGFAQLPTSSDYLGGGGSRSWGTPEMIAIIQNVLSEWNKRHPEVKVYVGNISLKDGGDISGHTSHELGVDADFSTSSNPSFTISDPGYDKNLAIELAKLLLDTGAIDVILYNDKEVESVIDKYATDNNLPGHMSWYVNHHHHFHIRIEPGLYTEACSE